MTFVEGSLISPTLPSPLSNKNTSTRGHLVSLMRNNQGVCESWGRRGADSSTQRAVAATAGPLGISTLATATLPLPLPSHHHQNQPPLPHHYHHHFHYYHCCTTHLTCPDLTCSSLHPSCSQYLPYIWNWTGSTSVLQLKCIHLISYVFQYCFELNGGIMKYFFLHSIIL